MPVLRIPTPLRAYTNGKSDITVNGSNISEALADLTTQYPTIKPHLFNEGGDLRPFVNLFVGENNIKDLQGVNTPIKDGEKIMLIPSIAGGSSSLRGAHVLFATKQSSSRRLLTALAYGASVGLLPSQ